MVERPERPAARVDYSFWSLTWRGGRGPSRCEYAPDPPGRVGGGKRFYLFCGYWIALLSVAPSAVVCPILLQYTQSDSKCSLPCRGYPQPR